MTNRGAAAPGARPRGRGFVYWGLLCLAIAVIGFWPSYFAPVLAGRYESPLPLMPLHVLTTALWSLMIVTQPALVVAGRIRQHRRNGTIGAVIAVGVIITGTFVQFEAMAFYAALDDPGNAVLTPFFRFVTLLVFAFGVWAALVYRHRSDWHKRLMLLATFALLEAPISRFFFYFMAAGDAAGLYAAIVHVALMLVFLGWDRLAHGRFHPATAWGTVVITLAIFGTAPLAFSDWWRNVAALLGRIMA